MKTPSLPEVVPADAAAIPEVFPTAPRQRRPGGRPAGWRGPAVIFGWLLRFAVGSVFCLNYFTSILVVGWTYRRVQALVLRGWWKQSRFRRAGPFEAFCAALGPDAPVLRPRWFLQERVAAALVRPAPDGRPPGRMRRLGRLLRVPWLALWRNFQVGVPALFCTYLLTGWGCLVMAFAWEFGWLNSFTKGYEQAWLGPAAGITGIVLFLAAMLYVPMAQVHQAATGDYRAFFDFRFIWRLVQARPLAYTGLAAFTAGVGLILEGLKTAPEFFDGHLDAWTNASDAEVLTMLQQYLFCCSLVLFAALLAVRHVAALVYRSAVLKVLRLGWVAPRDLHPVLAAWLDRLELAVAAPAVVARPGPGTGSIGWWLIGGIDTAVFVIALLALVVVGLLGWLVVLGGWVLLWVLVGVVPLARRGGAARYLRWNGRRAVFGLLFWIWFGFVAQTFVGEFLNYHPFAGFLNHPLVQFPCFDFVPTALKMTR